LSPTCVLSIDTDAVSNRSFMCQVHYKTKVDQRYLTVHIIGNVLTFHLFVLVFI
jgi:hypothetical protein